LRYFPREQMLVLKQEDLLTEHQKTLQRVYSFLAVEQPACLPLQRIVHVTEKRALLPGIRVGIRDELRQVFVPDLNDVERLTGLDVGKWLGR
jgi:hypothetical protein